ncbi:hypothetical protein B0H14DRAFT_3422943 [Mycena olivaceomarginata]|nr:hypothetical protein B0H14DRAFT_3422943 [Mycena olivaceomarginata]
MPKYGGELRTVHVSYGVNRTAAADHWAQWDKTRFASNVSRYMIEYLRTAYSQEDCANAALGGQTSVRPGAANGVAVDDDSDRDSAFPSDDETDDQEDDQDEEEEEEVGRSRKKRRVAMQKTGAAAGGASSRGEALSRRGGASSSGGHSGAEEQEEQEEQMEQEEEQEQEEPTMEQVIAAAEKKVLAAERKEATAELAAKKAELAHKKARECAGDDKEDEGLIQAAATAHDTRLEYARAYESSRAARIARNQARLASLNVVGDETLTMGQAVK